jgi:predicted nucleic acid-binding protein
MPAELPSAAIADAGPIIHLDELGVLFVLGGFREILVPDVVAMEAERHRPTWRSRAPAGLRTEDPPEERMRNFLRVASLDVGEAAALALWQGHTTAILLCDDLPARRYAEGIGCPVTGTLGLVLWAGRVGRLETERARALVKSIPERTTLHIRPALLDAALRSLEDD